MRVSLNQIKRYINFELPAVDELVAKINTQLGGVENVFDYGARYEGAIIARVMKCEKHPNADKLNVCEINAGGDERIQVVCGAPNVREGLLVVWLKPGATVPSTADDKEPFVLGARELRGVTSHGMLASPKELGLGDSHEGILELDPDEWKPSDVKVEPGVSFAKAYGLDDTIIDIENKMFTHRPDLFGQLGVAREVAGIHNEQFVSPDWYKVFPTFDRGEGPALDVTDDAYEAVPRFMTAVVSGITVKPSPVWLQAELVRLGGKPINNIVDVTNYVMLLTAQPTHAYDYDKLRGHKLGARMAEKGEKITLLNHKTYELDESDIVIVDGEGAVGLGGIMGGGDSEVSAGTTTIVLEVANFDMYTVRRSSMRHGLFTDALTRFTKGQSALQNPHVMSLLIASVKDVSNGAVVGTVTDLHKSDDRTSVHPPVRLELDFINTRLGLKLDMPFVRSLLEHVEFDVKQDGDTLQVTAPFWRTDIEQPEDIVEEVGRLYGFENLPRELPRRSAAPAPVNRSRDLKRRIRQSLSKAGANEVLTYSFVHEKVLKGADYGTDGAYRLSNALSPDLHYYRPRVLPSLLDKVHMNIKAGYDEFALFEIGKGHDKGLGDDDEGLPREPEFVDMVYAAKKPQDGAAFYKLRRLLDQLGDDLGIELSYTADEFTASTLLFEPARSAFVSDKASGAFIGMLGEFTPQVMKSFKLPAYSAGMTLDLDALMEAAVGAVDRYRPLARFPSVTQDVSIRSTGVSYADVAAAVKDTATSFADTMEVIFTPTVIYRPDDADDRTTTFHMTFTSSDRTLTDADVRPIVEAVGKAVADRFGAVIV